MFKPFLLINSVLVLFCTNSFAQKKFETAVAPSDDKIQLLSDAEYKKLLDRTNAELQARKLAETDRLDYATIIKDDLKNLTNEMVGGSKWASGQETAQKFEGVKNDAELAALIDRYEAQYNNLSPSAKIVAAQLIALKPYRGIFYRLRPLAEKQGTPFVHGMIISYLRGMNAGVNNIFPSDQWRAGFDYLTKPYPKMGDQIENEQEFYRYISTHILNSMLELANRIFDINLDQPVYLDNKIFWANANFVSDKDRYQLVGNAEKYAYLSAIFFSLTGTMNAIAYDWTDLFVATQDFWQVYGFNTLAFPDRMTAEKRTKVIRRFDRLFTLLPGGEAWTKKAYRMFNNGLRFAKLSWKITKGAGTNPSSTTTFMNPQAFMPFARIIDTSFIDIEQLNKGNGIASTMVNGESVQVNFKALFENPPRDLKDFLPITFEEGPRELTDKVTGLKYRNYAYGNPTGWKVRAFIPYFPNVRTSTDIRHTARILNQTWGGNVIGLPLATVLF